MADTILEQAMAALQTNLEAIKVSNGYETDVKQVLRMPGSGASRGSYPVINQWELQDTVQEGPGEQVPVLFVSRVKRVLLELWMRSRSDQPTDINNLIGDTIKAVKADHNLGGLVIDMEIQTVRIAVSDDSSLVGAEVDVNVWYRHRLSNPFSL